MKSKTIITVAASIAVIAACAVWTWRTQFNQPKFNVALHLGLGQTMAQLTAAAMDRTGKVVLITLPAGDFPELGVQVKEFKRIMATNTHVTYKEYELDTEDRPKFHFGAGLSARRYLRIVNKNLSASAIVSFVGAPDLTKKEAGEVKTAPRFIAECRTADKLGRLFEAKAIHAAVVGRFEYPTAIKGTPRNPSEWVEQRFQVVTATNASSLTGRSDDSDVTPREKAAPAATGR